MATHGSIGEFDPEKEDWTSYTERVEEYFVANDVDDATKERAILLSNCGSFTYQLTKQLFSPTKLKELTRLWSSGWQSTSLRNQLQLL